MEVALYDAMAAARLKKHIKEINDLRSTLGEECLSQLQQGHENSATSVSFIVYPPERTIPYDFSLDLGPKYLEGPAILQCTNDRSLDLTSLNEKLQRPCSLGRILSLVGVALGVGLEWGEETCALSDLETEMDEESDAESMQSDSPIDSDEDEEIMRAWSQRVVRWEAIEAGLSATVKGEKDGRPGLSERQIFDPRAAFRRLLNEMEEIFKAQDFDLMADASSEEGLFQWDVTIAGFPQEGALAGDLRESGRRYGTSTVQLQIQFKRVLHPFYPPSVRLVSPRFKGRLMLDLVCNSMLRPDVWDPVTTSKKLIMRVKDFLEKHGRVDFDDALFGNSYSEVEFLVTRLQSLTDVPPLSSPEKDKRKTTHVAQAPSATNAATGVNVTASAHMNERKRQCREEGDGRVAAWKAGTGYGTGNSEGEVWDAQRAEALQAARDAEICDVLRRVATEVKNASNQPPDSKTYENSMLVVHQSCLIPLLLRELVIASFHDMLARLPYYMSLIDCVDALAGMPGGDAGPSLHWLHDLTVNGRTIASTLHILRVQAVSFLRIAPEESEPNDSNCESNFAKLIIRVAERVSHIEAGSSSSTGLGRPSITTVPDPLDSPEGQYAAAMAPFKMRIVEDLAMNHVMREIAHREPGLTSTSRQRNRRVARELVSLESDLPESSIFVVADEQHTVLWKALIIGPKDTPYEGGMFLFDVYFPWDYPSRPPKVSFRTTGGGRVRFNPNLYHDGKVCLSLLGTWEGEKGESWNPEYSSILQVLISIQSLILVSKPFYNEPGYEAQRNDVESDRYNAKQMVNTLQWAILDQLKSPPPYFEDCIRTHFRLRGDAIISTVLNWIEFCEARNGAEADVMKSSLKELQMEIAKLKN